MKRKRHTREEIIRKLRGAEAQLASGAKIADVTRKLGVSENTFHRWRARYGGMGPSETKRLRELEKENAAEACGLRTSGLQVDRTGTCESAVRGQKACEAPGNATAHA